MSITAAELKQDLGKYLMLAEKEDIYITRDGRIVAKLTNPYQDRVDIAKSLFGILPADITLEEAREERDCTVTRNVKDYTKSTVPVYSPSDFLGQLRLQE